MEISSHDRCCSIFERVPFLFLRFPLGPSSTRANQRWVWWRYYKVLRVPHRTLVGAAVRRKLNPVGAFWWGAGAQWAVHQRTRIRQRAAKQPERQNIIGTNRNLRGTARTRLECLCELRTFRSPIKKNEAELLLPPTHSFETQIAARMSRDPTR